MKESISKDDKVVFWGRNDPFIKLWMKNCGYQITNPIPASLWSAYFVLGFIVRKSLNAAKALVLRIVGLFSRKRQLILKSFDNYDKAKFEVLFFPHQSLFYGQLFQKDH
ncbi:MAG: hypothetical protein Q7J27_04685, partial [Syntrophales bacterium]|nr:hypothetical protein [Syntrophales bacterium]